MSAIHRPRAGWKMPEPPAPDCVPWFHTVGPDGGCYLYWATEEQQRAGKRWTDVDGGALCSCIEWPFDDDVVCRKDLIALGFHEAG